MPKVKRVVLKIGSNSLTSVKGGICGAVMDRIAYIISLLREEHIECILVTSGALAAGMAKLHLAKRPRDIASRQAAAAVGQGLLIEKYTYFFDIYNLKCAQVLLSRVDLADAAHYKNARNTLEKLLSFDVVPIVNENDTVAYEELCFGDNDRLSALVAGLVSADLLVLMTDVDGLFTANPKKNQNAELIPLVEDVATVKGLADGVGSSVGTGGMRTKVQAAEIAVRFGIGAFLMNGNRVVDLAALKEGQMPHLGTYFAPAKHKLTGKKRWIAYGALSMGSLLVDQGAQRAMTQEGKSLLASGIVTVDGHWERRDMIRILNQEGREIARGIVELSSEELDLVKGCHSHAAQEKIVDWKGEEVVHRDNLVLFED